MFARIYRHLAVIRRQRMAARIEAIIAAQPAEEQAQIRAINRHLAEIFA